MVQQLPIFRIFSLSVVILQVVCVAFCTICIPNCSGLVSFPHKAIFFKCPHWTYFIFVINLYCSNCNYITTVSKQISSETNFSWEYPKNCPTLHLPPWHIFRLPTGPCLSTYLPTYQTTDPNKTADKQTEPNPSAFYYHVRLLPTHTKLNLIATWHKCANPVPVSGIQQVRKAIFLFVSYSFGKIRRDSVWCTLAKLVWRVGVCVCVCVVYEYESWFNQRAFTTFSCIIYSCCVVLCVWCCYQ